MKRAKQRKVKFHWGRRPRIIEIVTKTVSVLPRAVVGKWTVCTAADVVCLRSIGLERELIKAFKKEDKKRIKEIFGKK